MGIGTWLHLVIDSNTESPTTAARQLLLENGLLGLHDQHYSSVAINMYD